MKLVSNFYKNFSSKTYLPALVASFFAFTLYLITMPTTVQEGDTAELVLAGINLSLAHPPGYPLQVWYNFILTKLLFFLTPYQASSVGSTVIASVSAYFIAIWCTGWRGCLVAVLWTTSFLAWKWAVLPDVFSGFILFSLFFMSLLRRRELINTHFTFLLALSVLHQQLIIFLLPVLIYSWWPSRHNNKNNWRIAIYGLIALSGYFSLLLMNDTKPGSWGTVDDLGELWRHFTRHDYGSISLSAHQREIPIAHNLYYFTARFIESFWSILLISFLLWSDSSKKLSREILLILFVLILYFVVVIMRSSLNTDSFGIATLERFFLFPFLLIMLCTFINHRKSKFENIIYIVLTLNIATNLFLFSRINFYRNDTRVQDWSTTLLKQTPPNAILWVSGDTEINTTRYLQEVEGQRKDVLLMSSLDLADKDFQKVAKNYPAYFKQGNTWHEKIDWQSVQFYSNDLGIMRSNQFDKYVTGLSARYQPGTGKIYFNCLNKNHYQLNMPEKDYLHRPDIRSAMILSYGNCHLNAALQQMRSKDWENIKALMLAGLDIVSPNPFLQLQLCLSLKLLGQDESQCEEKASEIFSQTDPAFLPIEMNFR